MPEEVEKPTVDPEEVTKKQIIITHSILRSLFYLRCIKAENEFVKEMKVTLSPVNFILSRVGSQIEKSFSDVKSAVRNRPDLFEPFEVKITDEDAAVISEYLSEIMFLQNKKDLLKLIQMVKSGQAKIEVIN